jgi:predicted amidohydrolase
MRYVAAAIQFEPTLARPDLNVPSLLSLVEEAALHGARLVVLPEMANIGYCFDSREEVAPYLQPVPGPFTRQLEEVAARRGCVIVCGVGEVDEESDLYYNTAIVVGPQGYLGKYRKTHFFSADAKWAVEGDVGFPVWDTAVGRLGVEVCMDATYPEAGRLLALQGAEVICFPTNWVGSITPDHRWMSQAFENGVYWVTANRFGSERGLEFLGGSGIIAPDGTVRALASPGDGIVYAEIDLELARSRRFDTSRTEHKLADRRPELYLEMLQTPYTWSAAFYHSLYGSPGLPEPRSSRIAVVQCERPASDRPVTIDSVRSLLPAEALDLIVLPELLFSPVSPLDAGDEDGLHDIEPLLAVANQRSCLVAGTVIERDGERLFNTAVLVDGERVLGTQRKCHLTGDDLPWATPGTGPLRTIDTPLGRIGLTAGYDACFFETLRVLATQGADLVCVPSDIPWPLSHQIVGSQRRWTYWKSKAWESCVALAVANYAAPGRHGGSGIWVPDVKEDRSREHVTETDAGEVVVQTVDTHSRYLREKRGLGWRLPHWYKPLIQSVPMTRYEGPPVPVTGTPGII